MTPKCVLCNRRGLVVLDLDKIGATTLLKCDKVANKLVSLFKLWATPTLVDSPKVFVLQLPVDNALFNLFVIILLSKMRSGLLASSFYSEWKGYFSIILLAFIKKWYLKADLNKLKNRSPVSSALFLP